MKKKVLLSSIATIALCLCLITGSTFALFTSESETSIVVTAGEVDMVAGIAITSLQSVKGDPNGQIEDEDGNTYSYLYSDATAPYTFLSKKGTASVTGAILTVDKITPGDKVNVEITGTNNSNVPILYRYVIDCESGEELMKGLRFTVDGVLVDKYMETYTSPWMSLADGTDMTPVAISVELPVDANNDFEGLTTNIRILVEAVQGNAVVDTNVDPVITYYNVGNGNTGI